MYYSLYDRLLSQESLTRAFRKVKANNGKPGVDGQTVDDFAQDLTNEIVMLVRELREKSYRPQPGDDTQRRVRCEGTRHTDSS